MINTVTGNTYLVLYDKKDQAIYSVAAGNTSMNFCLQVKKELPYYLQSFSALFKMCCACAHLEILSARNFLSLGVRGAALSKWAPLKFCVH